ncbi:putative transcriptional regulator [Bacillus sp. RC242]|uniref:helix-turn-helix domain-containing protein n=1 Tax=Bacillus sp. RC242 TaxID=3156286 RepID=UPI00383831A6
MATATTVKIVRAFLDINQSELAKRMGVSASLVSAIEKRSKRITSNFIKRFKRAVGINDSVLMDIVCLQSKLGE